MATVRTTRVDVLGEAFTLRVRVNQDGLFRITLPEAVEQTDGRKEVVDSTMEAAEKAFWKAVEEHEKANTVVNRVILYQVEGTGFDNSSGGALGRLSFADGVGLAVAAGVFDEHVTATAGGDKYCRYEMTGGKRLAIGVNFSGPDAVHNQGLTPTQVSPKRRGDERARNAIPWTQEREDFFRDVIARMQLLHDRLGEVLGTEAAMDRFISDGGGRALLGGSSTQARHGDSAPGSEGP